MVNRLPLKGLTIVIVLLAMLVMATPSVAAPAEGPMNVSVHVVKPGDTLFSIARWYGVDVHDLARANHLVNPNRIWAGQRLVVPKGYAPPWYQPQPTAETYVVQPGDTLFSIAMRFGTSVDAIAMANNITNAGLIFAGQRLMIPDGTVPPAPAPKVIVKKIIVTPAPEPLKPAACNPLTKITFPRQGETLDGIGTFSILGTAAIEDFQFYKLELGLGTSPINFWSIAPVQRQSVVNGILLRDWNTGALPEGTYTLRLTVVDTSGQFPPPCDVIVHIDHPEGVDP